MPDRTSKPSRPARGSSGDVTAPNERTYISSYEEQLAAGTALIDVPMPDEKEPPNAESKPKRRKKGNGLWSVGIGLFQSDERLHIGAIDVPFFLLLLAITVVGLITLFSASYTAAYYKFGNPYHYIASQALYAVVGILVALVISKIPYQKLHRLAVPALVVAFVLLVLVLFIGTNLNTEAKRWIQIGPLPTFQPSEIAKAALVIAFASLCVRMRDRIKKPSSLLPFFLILGAMAFFLLEQPHLSATIIILVTGFVILFVGGANMGYLAGIISIGSAGLAWLVLGPIHYQYDRIETWLNPFADPLGEGFQMLQSLYAVGSGGLWGLGLGQSRQKQMYLPEPYNDFIFSIACEELGFIGATLIILLFAAFVIRGFYIALRSRDTFGTLLVVGFMTQIAVQVFFNIGVVSGLLPVTGASLPFFSSGGTSALMLYAQMGVVLAVSRQMTMKT
ncbi:MAG: putative lipid II flippase FtsW [Clostridiaceae bacterium]|nr:putative lipid II flippase FtsW [Clostridiaceae bacterium]